MMTPITRIRAIRRLMLVVVTCLVMPGAIPAGGTTAAAERPNILIVISDDLDYAKLGYNGYRLVDTPHIDSIIRGGTYFTNGYVSGPVCAPTRAGLMTGRYQARFRYETLTGPITRQIKADYGVDTREILLPQYLKRAGYATGLIGKWHLGYNDKYHPNERGIDSFFGFLAGGHDYFEWDTPPVAAMGGPILRNKQKASGSGYITEALAQEAAGFIRIHKQAPFFLYFAPFNVHGPFVVPDEYKPAGGNVMAGMVKALDDAVGVVLAALESEGLLEDTLIFYVNDNGGLRDNSPFRGRKGQLYEGGIRVPFAVRWPGHIPAGATYDQPVIQLDILPTLLSVVGETPDGDRQIDGVNLLPYLRGEQTGRPHELLFWRYTRRARAVRSGDLKLYLPPQGEPELYDLSRDVGEAKNLAAGRPDDVARLTGKIAAWEDQVAAAQYGLTDANAASGR